MTKASKTASPDSQTTPAPSKQGTRRTSVGGARGGGTGRSPSPATSASRRSKSSTPKTEVSVADRFLDDQRSLLLAERATYAQQAESLRAEAEQLAEDMEPGDIQFDEESGEGGTLNVERERDLALSAQALAAVDEIDRALAKIDKGTYGLCERCSQPIKKARLKALPQASLCVECKTGGLSRR